MNGLPLLAGFLFVALLTPSIAADSPHGPGSASPRLTDTNTVAEFKKIEAADDASQAEVDQWIRENNDLKAKGQGLPEADLERRISTRFEPVRQAYEDFVRLHPTDANAHLVYGSFLNDRQDETGAQAQWEKALQLDPSNPAVYNNLAGRYTETGPANKVFEYFAKAIELGPSEAVFYRNFGDGLYVLRTHATAYYGITEQQVYGKVLVLYSNALRLDPQNFSFARDYAQTYYSLKPLPFDTALTAWTNALRVARSQNEREEVYIHMARLEMLAGRFAAARARLGTVTNESSLKAKTNLLHNLAEREKERPPATSEPRKP